MFDGLVSAGSINFLLVFLEGVLSFFSPCVIPLIPLYISYLAGSARQVDENGEVTFRRKRVFFYTLFFIIGISAAFFLLGLSFTALGRFFSHYKNVFVRVGGILIILLGLLQLGVFGDLFKREHRLNLHINPDKMNPLLALVMGFTFSFAWTPCVGPMLSSVLILASGAKDSLTGNLLVVVYALGFVIPFLLLGLFTTQMLNFLKKKQKLLKYTIKVGGVILILMGIMTFTGWLNGVTGYLNSLGGNAPQGSIAPQPNTEQTPDEGEPSEPPEDAAPDEDAIPAPDFTLTDQNGESHTLSDYQGKVVFLNFWATWCGPCQMEMPHIQELYELYGDDSEDVAILTVANPRSSEYPTNSDIEADQITEFLEEKGYTFPAVYDTTGEVFAAYGISAFPTTFMIDREGNVFGYIASTLTREMMDSIIDQTLTGKRAE